MVSALVQFDSSVGRYFFEFYVFDFGCCNDKVQELVDFENELLGGIPLWVIILGD